MALDLLDLSINLPFVDELYARFLKDPEAVDPSWRTLFAGGPPLPSERPPPPVAERVAAAQAPPLLERRAPEAIEAIEARFGQVYALVNAYRSRGHLEAELDPLGHLQRPPHPELDPRSYGFSEADLDRLVPSGGFVGLEATTLRELVQRLRRTYCGPIGVQMMHITDPEKRRWLQDRMEPVLNTPPLDRELHLYLLQRLSAAEEFERFCHTKFVGTKRFSLEGGETLIPLLDLVVELASAEGVEEIVLGMAHRGRLNVLVNVMGKEAGDIFAEFEDIDPRSMFGGGDVKYHLGFSSDRQTRAGRSMHLTLAFNPSHLEAVDPVVLGRVRAKQRRRAAQGRALGVLVHGDAAFAGQGLVAEILNMAQLRGYRTGGTVHVVVNNQIGFTTSPTDSRSSTYATDVAKVTQVPIFHVNGDHPEAVMQVVRTAMDYRRAFLSDVVIDMYCFRKYGHNEADEPSFTQPLLYRLIEAHPTVRELYGRRLIESGELSQAEVDAIVAQARERLERAFQQERSRRPQVQAMAGYWKGYTGGPDLEPDPETGVPREHLTQLGERLSTLPEGFRANPKVLRLLAQREKMGRGELPLDWGMGEALAFGSLLWDGTIVRVSGQDSRRGTFSHRHAVIVDQRTQEEYCPLANLKEPQGRFSIYDSPLSEAGVLGFEFGYSLDYPDGLVIWEAQFGDFANGAQMIVDQFITSSEDKWKRLSGLVMLLPHGFEGQGPEHSSARFERYLESCAEDNIQVVYPTTPAQFFHLLRRQVLRRWRKPLIVMTPKSLLRLPAARSPLEDLTTGSFQRILLDPEPPPSAGIRRVVLCTGKIYYELSAERRRIEDQRTALVRIEQLYPLSDQELRRALEAYPEADEVVWVQEEPSNMGALHYIYVRLLALVGSRSLKGVTRTESASPATGSYKAHVLEQEQLLGQAFGPLDQIASVDPVAPID